MAIEDEGEVLFVDFAPWTPNSERSECAEANVSENLDLVALALKRKPLGFQRKISAPLLRQRRGSRAARCAPSAPARAEWGRSGSLARATRTLAQNTHKTPTTTKAPKTKNAYHSKLSRAGARTGLQLQGHGDTQGFNSTSPAFWRAFAPTRQLDKAMPTLPHHLPVWPNG